MPSPYTIAVIGLWHCGEVYSAGLAELGHKVLGLSDDEGVVLNLNHGRPPLPEPRLNEILVKNIAAGNLRYATDFAEIKKCNVVWFAFDTPVDDEDVADMTPIFSALEKIIPHLPDDVLVVMTSQVPVGTAVRVRDIIRGARPDLRFDYVCTPENLRLGEAVRCFMEPGRIVAGAASKLAFEKIDEIFAPLKVPMLHMSPASSEMAKHALNSFFALSISFMNDIADLCEATNADVQDVVAALRSDPRIGQKAALGAGLGFSGGTLGRDLKALIATAKQHDLRLPVIESALQKNIERKVVVGKRLKEQLHELKGKTVAIFGLTYKPGTKTLRRSRSLEIARGLSDDGAVLRLCDPAVAEDEMSAIKNATFVSDPYEAASGAAAIVVITPWPEFRDLDFKRLGSAAPGAVLLDTYNLLYDKEDFIKGCGINYFGTGRSSHGA